MRTADTAWFPFNDSSITVNLAPQDELGRELYDHRGDTGRWLDYPGEAVNVVSRPEHAQLVEVLHQRLLDYVRLKPAHQ